MYVCTTQKVKCLMVGHRASHVKKVFFDWTQTWLFCLFFRCSYFEFSRNVALVPRRTASHAVVSEFVAALKERKILIHTSGLNLMRVVTHLDVSMEQVKKTVTCRPVPKVKTKFNHVTF